LHREAIKRSEVNQGAAAVTGRCVDAFAWPFPGWRGEMPEKKKMSMMSRVAVESQSRGLPGAGLFVGAMRKLARWLRALLEHWNRRAAVKALSELDDHALHDIGLLRSQIEDAVTGEAIRRGY
jgi:uncharacterized protein YjiS (DUF1127 family)